jgi:hypothetical protein
MFTPSTACLEVKPALPRFRDLEFCFDEDRQMPLHYLPLAVQAKLTPTSLCGKCLPSCLLGGFAPGDLLGRYKERQSRAIAYYYRGGCE